VVEIRGSGDVEHEWNATWQRLAPKELVIPPECWTERVRISSGRRVRSEVEGDVDHIDERKGLATPGGQKNHQADHVPGLPASSSTFGATASLKNGGGTGRLWTIDPSPK
jgi:hypothetical protein